MTKKELAIALSLSSGVSVNNATKLLSSFGEVLSTILKSGDKVYLRGLGTFKSVAVKARYSRNPSTGATIWIDAKQKPVLLFGDSFKDSLQ